MVRNTQPELRTTTIKTWLDWFPEDTFGKFNWAPPFTHRIRKGELDIEVIFLALDKPEDVKKWFRPQQWNTMTVMAQGRRVAVDVNGHKSAELRDDPGRLQGRLALQVHGGQDCEVWFKGIEMLVKAQ